MDMEHKQFSEANASKQIKIKLNTTKIVTKTIVDVSWWKLFHHPVSVVIVLSKNCGTEEAKKHTVHLWTNKKNKTNSIEFLNIFIDFKCTRYNKKTKAMGNTDEWRKNDRQY